MKKDSDVMFALKRKHDNTILFDYGHSVVHIRLHLPFIYLNSFDLGNCSCVLSSADCFKINSRITIGMSNSLARSKLFAKVISRRKS